MQPHLVVPQKISASIPGPVCAPITGQFLFEQLERREAIADAKGAGDTAELAVMKKAIEKEKDELLNEVADAFDVKSDVSLAAEDLKKVMFLNRQLLDFE